MNRAYYSAPIKKFLEDKPDSILGELTRNHQFDLEELQRNSWLAQIYLLKSSLKKLSDSYIAFEYSIPRMGKRVDVILLYSGAIFVLEFKVGETKYPNFAMEQALNYAIDLKNFHEQSHRREIIPIVIATDASPQPSPINKYPDGVYYPIKANKENFTFIVW